MEKQTTPWRVWFVLAAFVVGIVALSGGGAPADAALGYLFYPGLAVWAWVGLAGPLLAFGLTAAVSLFYALSWVAPDFERPCMVDPLPPTSRTGSLGFD